MLRARMELSAALPVTFEACSPIVTLGPYLLGGSPCKFVKFYKGVGVRANLGLWWVSALFFRVPGLLNSIIIKSP